MINIFFFFFYIKYCFDTAAYDVSASVSFSIQLKSVIASRIKTKLYTCATEKKVFQVSL